MMPCVLQGMLCEPLMCGATAVCHLQHALDLRYKLGEGPQAHDACDGPWNAQALICVHALAADLADEPAAGHQPAQAHCRAGCSASPADQRDSLSVFLPAR